MQLDLEECIDLEIVKTEKRRLEIFLGVMVFTLLLLLLNISFFPTSISEVFLDERSLKLGIYISLAFILPLVRFQMDGRKNCKLRKTITCLV